ncbi:hypothetical protein O181_091608 [Austropuccinia psidii MF-1]|uniref:Vacuolar protein sorting-associated protein 13 VPS13 adaptor binding domain-containing protein n=1 Tax=Austropuccinia psidii MF-1 TaxID=1389203 RepID=A0A9Q3IXP8_9BASI|nr:hypothetical protein [Austropuccinia psidii MF-1]
MTGTDIWGWEGKNVLHQKCGIVFPYLIKNPTGYPLKVSEESEEKFHKGKEYLVEDSKSIPWRFEDWKLMREVRVSKLFICYEGELTSLFQSVMSPTQSKLRIVLDRARWEAVSGISVVRESVEVYPLCPSFDGVTHCLLCHAAIRDNVKEVIFWSTFQVPNNTSLPIEISGGSCSVPIEAAYHQRIKIRPYSGFGFKWCKEALAWKDLVKHPVRTIACQSINLEEPSQRLTATTIYDKEDSSVRYYPKINLRLRASIEIENLLLFHIQFYLLLLGVAFQDDGFVGLKHSQYAIVDTNNPEDFPVENRLIMEDEDGLKIKLSLHFMRVPLCH